MYCGRAKVQSAKLGGSAPRLGPSIKPHRTASRAEWNTRRLSVVKPDEQARVADIRGAARRDTTAGRHGGEKVDPPGQRQYLIDRRSRCWARRPAGST